VCVHLRVCAWVCACVRARVLLIYTYIYMSVCECMHIHMHMYVHVYIYTWTYKYICRYKYTMYVQTCIYITQHNQIPKTYTTYLHSYLTHSLPRKDFISNEGKSMYIHVYTLQHTATHCNTLQHTHLTHALQRGEVFSSMNENL